MKTPFEIGDEFVDSYAAIDPVAATFFGTAGHDGEWGDQGMTGYEARRSLLREVAAALDPHRDHPDRKQRLAARVIGAHVQEVLSGFQVGEHLRDLSHMASTFENFVQVFDLMDKDSAAGWGDIQRRLESLAGAIAGLEERLEEGRSQKSTVAVRQVESVVSQARELAGPASAFLGLIERAPAELRSQIEAAAASARGAAEGFARYLEHTYMPDATAVDGVGEERYVMAAERFLGLAIDPFDTYEWGWEELARLREEASLVAEALIPGGGIREAANLLETDPDRAAPSRAAFLDFVAKLQKRALDDLSGVHFDVPPEIAEVTVNLAPPGGALGAYYHGPSEDFTRPGGIYYSIPGEGPVPLYQEVSTAYHEGFPGHHLQVGLALAVAEDLSRPQRALIWYPGYGEGWALYAERLMQELGYFDKPDYVFGMLASHIFRAARVVTDIGLHLGLEIPESSPILGGEKWNFDTAVSFMSEIGLQKKSYATSEVLRYLGWPGQAISYKLGEREILDIREEDRRRRGAAFDLKDFHRRVLEGGAMRLDLLREVVLEW